ncbi:hypothetical protein [Epilithonimonas zeae]|uniref:hypothetical protein n=1 Tax=Epilithonimonas zeae TaxID=1416779 RepID=UPI00200F9D0B|nr:hypothetical protein [Epilithonimonas zeae]UQB69458.1 hypothetical protein KI430_03245 [Epilithonimonas zeae]
MKIIDFDKQINANPYLLNIYNNIPKIDFQKKYDWALHSENIIREFPHSQYCNFDLKWLEIVQRIDNVNDLIKELFSDFILLNLVIDPDPLQDGMRKTPLHYKQKFLTEQIFYWIRKTVDELISLIFVLEFLKQNGNNYPEKINTDCIGKLIQTNDFIPDIKSKHLNFLVLINDISNAYKHSFHNSETYSLIGINDPLAHAYGFKLNNVNKEVLFTAHKIEDIINSLNILICDMIDYIKKI